MRSITPLNQVKATLLDGEVIVSCWKAPITLNGNRRNYQLLVLALILPKACLDEIDSICSKFLWKGKTDGPTAAKVSWEKVTTPREEGGLGLRKVGLWNIASVLKLIWILFFKPHSIWSHWYKTEVLEGNLNNFWVINTKQKNSWLANKLLLLRDNAYDFIKHLVGNGETTYFWTSN